MNKRLVAATYTFAGILHFVRPGMYEAIMPRYLKRWKRELVLASGVTELAGGLSVYPAPKAARWILLATLVGVFPVHVEMVAHPERFPKVPLWAAWVRIPIQFFFAWQVLEATRN